MGFSIATSPPSRGRGLKPAVRWLEAQIGQVAPFAGAWIETALCAFAMQQVRVAPFAGAWIETVGSRSQEMALWVAPFAGAWIETKTLSVNSRRSLSPPSRGRGLKRPLLKDGVRLAWVAPFAGAWIETAWHQGPCRPHRVAPFAGAWIETIDPASGTASRSGRPLRGGVD